MNVTLIPIVVGEDGLYLDMTRLPGAQRGPCVSTVASDKDSDDNALKHEWFGSEDYDWWVENRHHLGTLSADEGHLFDPAHRRYGEFTMALDGHGRDGEFTWTLRQALEKTGDTGGWRVSLGGGLGDVMQESDGTIRVELTLEGVQALKLALDGPGDLASEADALIANGTTDDGMAPEQTGEIDPSETP